jgi:hypothetical protein
MGSLLRRRRAIIVLAFYAIKEEGTASLRPPFSSLAPSVERYAVYRIRAMTVCMSSDAVVMLFEFA